jgi:hypothetical protein
MYAVTKAEAMDIMNRSAGADTGLSFFGLIPLTILPSFGID